jgi:hypothetical protein
MPEPIIDDLSGATVIQSAPVFSSHMGLLDADAIVDAAGNIFHAARFQDGNWTRAYVTKTTPAGVVVGRWQVGAGHAYKLDSLGLTASGADLLVATVAHDTPNPPPPEGRLSTFAVAVIPGVFVPFGNQIPKAGAAGAFVPQIEQEPQVDYDRIAQIVQVKVEAGIDDLAQRFGDDGPRRAIFDKAGDALLYMSDPGNHGAEWKTGRYQDVIYERDLQRQYEALNKHIIGENPALPIENQGYIELIKRCVREVLREGDPA